MGVASPLYMLPYNHGHGGVDGFRTFTTSITQFVYKWGWIKTLPPFLHSLHKNVHVNRWSACGVIIFSPAVRPMSHFDMYFLSNEVQVQPK